jgi:hypothetical protein
MGKLWPTQFAIAFRYSNYMFGERFEKWINKH